MPTCFTPPGTRVQTDHDMAIVELLPRSGTADAKGLGLVGDVATPLTCGTPIRPAGAAWGDLRGLHTILSDWPSTMYSSHR
jgi:hypothetical protein